MNLQLHSSCRSGPHSTTRNGLHTRTLGEDQRDGHTPTGSDPLGKPWWPFGSVTLSATIPDPIGYPRNPERVGEHIKRGRLFGLRGGRGDSLRRFWRVRARGLQVCRGGVWGVRKDLNIHKHWRLTSLDGPPGLGVADTPDEVLRYSYQTVGILRGRLTETQRGTAIMKNTRHHVVSVGSMTERLGGVRGRPPR